MRALAASAARVRVTLERRRRGTRVTVIEGFGADVDVAPVARVLKARLGTGGTCKGGRVELQGDQVRRLAPLLADLGFAEA